jgi:hypothetical protein
MAKTFVVDEEPKSSSLGERPFDVRLPDIRAANDP